MQPLKPQPNVNGCKGLCDKLDNDCDGMADEDIFAVCGTGTDGKPLTKKCSSGAWGTCSGKAESPDKPVKELCGNGIDDNGDGKVDENCDTTPPATSIYLSESPDQSTRNDYTYKLTVYAHVTNWEPESNVSYCEINWNDGFGWEQAGKGAAGNASTLKHTYQKPGMKKVEYRCSSEGGTSQTDKRFSGFDVIDVRDGTPPSTKIYLGNTTEPAHKSETASLTV